MTILTYSAIIAAGATLYFFVFWRWFAYWRLHQIQTYALMFGTFAALGVAIYVGRGVVFANRIDVPAGVQVVGWTLIVLASALGFVADRQIGIRVRSFTPFFEAHGRIALKTTGAYGVVRHPIYVGLNLLALGGHFLEIVLLDDFQVLKMAWGLEHCWLTQVYHVNEKMEQGPLLVCALYILQLD